MGQVMVLALLSAKKGQEDEVRRLALGLIEPTRAEPGCVLYELHQDQNNPASFMFYEIWARREQLDLHSKSSHLAEFGRKVQGLLTEPAWVTTWDKIS
jgi:quinol monooxygenase YgiN